MLVVAVLATPSHAASRPRPRRGEALIDTRNRTDFSIKLETDAPALSLAASASRKLDKAAELLLHQDVLGVGWALFGAWPVVGTFHPTFSYPINLSKFSGVASRAAAPAIFKPISAAADSELDLIKASGSTSNKTDCTTATAHSKIEIEIGKTFPTTSKLLVGAYAELAPFDATSGATKIGDTSLETSFTTATAHSKSEADERDTKCTVIGAGPGGVLAADVMAGTDGCGDSLRLFERGGLPLAGTYDTLPFYDTFGKQETYVVGLTVAGVYSWRRVYVANGRVRSQPAGLGP